MERLLLHTNVVPNQGQEYQCASDFDHMPSHWAGRHYYKLDQSGSTTLWNNASKDFKFQSRLIKLCYWVQINRLIIIIIWRSTIYLFKCAALGMNVWPLCTRQILNKTSTVNSKSHINHIFIFKLHTYKGQKVVFLHQF